MVDKHNFLVAKDILYTVDLVIFACFNFREFVILELFASSSLRKFLF